MRNKEPITVTLETEVIAKLATLVIPGERSRSSIVNQILKEGLRKK